jgi:hypothetical protein
MAQSTILAAGTTNATSTDITIAVGASANVGIFVASGSIPSDALFRVLMDSPGGDVPLISLDQGRPTTSIAGPGLFRVERLIANVATGVWLEQ